MDLENGSLAKICGRYNVPLYFYGSKTINFPVVLNGK